MNKKYKLVLYCDYDRESKELGYTHNNNSINILINKLIEKNKVNRMAEIFQALYGYEKQILKWQCWGTEKKINKLKKDIETLLTIGGYYKDLNSVLCENEVTEYTDVLYLKAVKTISFNTKILGS